MSTGSRLRNSRPSGPGPREAAAVTSSSASWSKLSPHDLQSLDQPTRWVPHAGQTVVIAPNRPRVLSCPNAVVSAGSS